MGEIVEGLRPRSWIGIEAIFITKGEPRAGDLPRDGILIHIGDPTHVGHRVGLEAPKDVVELRIQLQRLVSEGQAEGPRIGRRTIADTHEILTDNGLTETLLRTLSVTEHQFAREWIDPEGIQPIDIVIRATHLVVGIDIVARIDGGLPIEVEHLTTVVGQGCTEREAPVFAAKKARRSRELHPLVAQTTHIIQHREEAIARWDIRHNEGVLRITAVEVHVERMGMSQLDREAEVHTLELLGLQAVIVESRETDEAILICVERALLVGEDGHS